MKERAQQTCLSTKSNEFRLHPRCSTSIFYSPTHTTSLFKGYLRQQRGATKSPHPKTSSSRHASYIQLNVIHHPSPDTPCLDVQEPFLDAFTQDIILLRRLFHRFTIEIDLTVNISMMFGEIVVDTLDHFF